MNNLIALMFNVPQGDVWVDTHGGDKCICIVRRDNKTCDGNVQYLESQGGTVLRKKKKVKDKSKTKSTSVSSKLDVYIIPMTTIVLFEDISNFKYHHEYILLHQGFTQLLARHLKPEQYEFKEKFLRIKVKKEEAAILQPLFSNPNWNGSVTEEQAGFSINFDFLSEMHCSKLFSFFAELSKDREPVIFDNLPITIYYNRVLRLLELTATSSSITFDTFVDGEPALHMPSIHDASVRVLETYFHIQGISHIKVKGAILLKRSVAVMLMPTLAESLFEQDFRKFLTEQKAIVKLVNDTEKLGCQYAGKTFLIYNNSKLGKSYDEAIIVPLMAYSITPKSIGNSVIMCLNALALVECIDQYPDYFTSKFERGFLYITSTGAQLSRQLEKVVNELSYPRLNTICYKIDIFKMWENYRNISMDLSHELLTLIPMARIKDQFISRIKEAFACLPNAKFTVNINGDDVRINFNATLIPLVSALLHALNLQQKPLTANSDFTVPVAFLRRFMSVDVSTIFESVKMRSQMFKRYQTMLVKDFADCRELFTGAVQKAMYPDHPECPIDMNEVFFSINEQGLVTIAAAVRAKLEAEKKRTEDDKYKKQITQAAAADNEYTPVRFLKPKVATSTAGITGKLQGSNNGKKGQKINRSQADDKQQSKSTGTGKNAAAQPPAAVKSQKPNKSGYHGLPHNLEQDPARRAVVRGNASFYDYDSTRHNELAATNSFIPNLPTLQPTTDAELTFFQREENPPDAVIEDEAANSNSPRSNSPDL